MLVVLPLLALIVGRRPLAHLAFNRALVNAGLTPASFEVTSVGIGSLQIADLAIGEPPWLAAEELEVSYSLAGLLNARAEAIRIAGAAWTINATGGAVDWGFTSGATPALPDLNLPVDLLKVDRSTVLVTMPNAVVQLPVSLSASPSADGGLVASLDLQALRRRVIAQVTASATDALRVEITAEIGAAAERGIALPGDVPALPAADDTPTSGENPIPTVPQAVIKATLVRALDGSMQFDLTSTLTNAAEPVGDSVITVPDGVITASAALDADGQTTFANARVRLRNPAFGAIILRSLDLSAAKSAGPDIALTLAARADQWHLPALESTLRWQSENTADSNASNPLVFNTTFRTSQPVTLSLEEGETRSRVEAVFGDLSFAVAQGAFTPRTGSVALRGGSLSAGDFSVTDARADAVLSAPDTIRVTSLAANVGNGGFVSADPFSWDFTGAVLDVRVNLDNLSLEQWLPVLSKSRATGEGRVSGNVDLALDWAAGPVRVSNVAGSLRADPSRGFIQATDADALGELLIRQNPRFATDKVMKPIGDKIIAALRDFAFHTLTVDLSREGNRTVALTRLAGFGRKGEDPQGINLTLDLRVDDAFLDLSARLAGQAKIRGAARNALDRFFDKSQPDPTQEKP